VQEHIQTVAREQGTSLILEQEITLADGKTGKADIYNPATSEIWEVKSMGPASLGAEEQLRKYCDGTIGNSAIKPIRGRSQFYGIFECEEFVVAYFSPQSGVVLYKFWRKKKKQRDPVFVPVVVVCPAFSSAKKSKETVFGLTVDAM
jgi:hypothetical protein